MLDSQQKTHQSLCCRASNRKITRHEDLARAVHVVLTSPRARAGGSSSCGWRSPRALRSCRFRTSTSPAASAASGSREACAQRPYDRRCSATSTATLSLGNPRIVVCTSRQVISHTPPKAPPAASRPARTAAASGNHTEPMIDTSATTATNASHPAGLRMINASPHVGPCAGGYWPLRN
jgi:hypothetical protein